VSAARARIDGREVDVAPGETVLDAATRLGIEVPTLCFTKGLAPEGGCRLCLVEAEGHVHPLAACHTPLRDGMVVRTGSPRLEDLRRRMLALHLAESRDGRFVPSAKGDAFERLLAAYQVSVDRPHDGAPAALDASHPYMRFDATRCIECRRCLHVCEDVQGRFVYAFEGRGEAARLVFGATDCFAESPCVACGACVDACPTGAVSDRDRTSAAPAETRVRSTCGYCGVGCQVEIAAAEGRVLRVGGVASSPVNRGHLCVKGRYAHAWHHAFDRLTEPLLRKGHDLVPVSWEEALGFAAEQLAAIRDRDGGEALAVLTSSRSSNEAAYLLQRIFRTRLRTNHVDCCARVCHASTAEALSQVTGTGASTASYADIERARTIVVAGANPTEAHPVIGARLLQQVRRGARLVVIDPRRIELAEWADVHLPVRPGTNVPLLHALAQLLLAMGRADLEYVATRCEGLEALEAHLATSSPEARAELAGVAPGALRAAAEILGAGPVLFVHGLGLSELTQGVASVKALANLAMLTGSVGRPGAGLLPLRGQNNVQGNADMGGMPDRITGYQPVADPALREHAASIWGAPPPAEPGFTLPGMLDAAVAGRLRALWIQGEDLAQSDPNQHHVMAALGSLELLVVQELFLTETARHAHVVLPAASFFEQEGTFTNAERRVQLVRAAVPPPGRARPDWEVAGELGLALGDTARPASPAALMEEIAQVAPRLFGGVRHDRLEPDGLQWPCPDITHPGTATLHAEGFLVGRGLLSPVPYVPSPEDAVPDRPLTLVTGRILDHYNVGTMTRRTPSRALAPHDPLEIHPDDARAAGIAEGDLVALESRWGEARARAHLTDRVAPGTLFLSFHYPETHANRVTGPQRDPESDCPEYKVTAVRLRRAALPEDARAEEGENRAGPDPRFA
jgi:formate dehydrogenase major subunit